MKSWPKYASHEEDMKFRKKKWNEKYNKTRVVMWDDTNIPFRFAPSSALNQRISFSLYYNENCAKGGVFLQLCGWGGVGDLWSGRISDNDYMELNKIFEEQENFAKKDTLPGEDVLPFTNILDKGYRVTLLAMKCGNQTVVQPVFSSADLQFLAEEVHRSASVATDRSGNERKVNHSKLSDFLQRGLRSSSCPTRMNNTWLSWAFQTNFMYKSVL